MKVKEIYSGTWLPRTHVHLDELYHFFADATTSSSLEQERLRQLRKRVGAKEFGFHKGVIDELHVNCVQGHFIATEDGVLVVKKVVKNLNQDYKRINDFFLSKILPAVSYLFSTGAPLPKVYKSLDSIMPVVIWASTAHQSDIEALFKAFGDTMHLHMQGKGKHVFFGEKITLVVSRKTLSEQFINYLIFAQDMSRQMAKLTTVHRIIWDEISELREKKEIQNKELPFLRDELLDMKKEISYFRSRLSQMKHILAQRLRLADDLLEASPVSEQMKHDLFSLESSHAYVEELWLMTDRYVDSTFELITLLYQENQQRELTVLQTIFLIGVIASILSLGTLSGARIMMYDDQGIAQNVGALQGFSIADLVLFGSTALVVGFLVYLVLHVVLTRMKRFRVIDVTGVRSKNLEKLLNRS